jgi:hypothetical protein
MRAIGTNEILASDFENASEYRKYFIIFEGGPIGRLRKAGAEKRLLDSISQIFPGCFVSLHLDEVAAGKIQIGSR